MAANLALRFACELAALAAVAWWGWERGGATLMLAAPVVVAVVWGLLLAPKRRFDLPHPARFALELAVWVGAALALADVWSVVAGVVFGVVAVVSGAINYRAAG